MSAKLHRGGGLHAMSVLRCFATSIVHEGAANAELERLIQSLSVSFADDAGRLYLLLQNTQEAAPLDLEQHTFITCLTTPAILSLSAARNILLRHYNRDIQDEDIVAFPDDDAWYTADFGQNLRHIFSADPQLDFFFCRYGSHPEALDAGETFQLASIADVMKNASSITIFASGHAVRATGGMDEELGVGAKFRGGEDTDFALRLASVSRKTMWTPRALVGHRDKIGLDASRYYIGALAAIARNTNRQPAMYYQVLRKIAVGGYYVLRGRLSLWRWIADTVQALSASRPAQASRTGAFLAKSPSS